MGMFDFLKKALKKTKKAIKEVVDSVSGEELEELDEGTEVTAQEVAKASADSITKSQSKLKKKSKRDPKITLETLEEILLSSDAGLELTEEILERLEEEEGDVVRLSKVKEVLKNYLVFEPLNFRRSGPSVFMFIGVNGSGKTTTIAKVSKRLKDEGRKVLLAAGDTFRAAAIEQLEWWAKKIGVDIVKHQQGSDAAAVAYDAVEAAVARGVDVVLVDTAGRLHNKMQLMEELLKVKRVIGKKVLDEPREILLVLDANNGQNAVVQAEKFSREVGTTGVIVTKLDSSAKAGFVFSIYKKLGLPVKFIGVGEKVEDLYEFSPDEFIDAFFDGLV